MKPYIPGMGESTSRNILLASDSVISIIHYFLFVRHRIASVTLFSALYAAIVFFAGPWLGVSANYFVIGPVISFAFAFGFPGGTIAGLLGLPVNLLFFCLSGHPEFAPNNIAIAEISGIILGVTLGYLADFFRRLEGEIKRREIAEEKLRQSLYMKDALLEELHHRVKNNLNVIKSVIKLQMNRSTDPEFLLEGENIVRRIYSFSLIYDQLYSIDDLSVIKVDTYLAKLANNVIAGTVDPGKKIATVFRFDPVILPISQASILGLIANEVITNCVKHAFPGSDHPELFLDFSRVNDTNILVIRDNGPGMRGNGDIEGLGLTIVGTLVSHLNGTCVFRDESGTVFELVFPVLNI